MDTKYQGAPGMWIRQMFLEKESSLIKISINFLLFGRQDEVKLYIIMHT